MVVTEIDTTRVDPRLRLRHVASCTPDGDGHMVRFEECRHTVWFAVKPGQIAYCGGCLNDLTEEARHQLRGGRNGTKESQ